METFLKNEIEQAMETTKGELNLNVKQKEAIELYMRQFLYNLLGDNEENEYFIEKMLDKYIIK